MREVKRKKKQWQSFQAFNSNRFTSSQVVAVVAPKVCGPFELLAVCIYPGVVLSLFKVLIVVLV